MCLCIAADIRGKATFTLKVNPVPFFLKISHLSDADMYYLYQVIFVLKYNLRQLNINSCLLSYKNIYKNRVFKGGGYSY